jgi:hypothetical protein
LAADQNRLHKIEAAKILLFQLKTMALASDFCGFLKTVECQCRPRSWVYNKETQIYVESQSGPNRQNKRVYEITIRYKDAIEKARCQTHFETMIEYFNNRSLLAKEYQLEDQEKASQFRLLLLDSYPLTKKVAAFFYKREYNRLLKSISIIGNDQWPPQELCDYYD